MIIMMIANMLSCLCSVLLLILAISTSVISLPSQVIVSEISTKVTVKNYLDNESIMSTVPTPSPALTNPRPHKSDGRSKLLLLGLDGIRWDYYTRYKNKLPGFRHLLENGVQAEYVEPIFPSLTYPSWTTILTGLFPNKHNIVGNYMVCSPNEENSEEVIFDLLDDNSSKVEVWWKSAEPFWITVTKAGHKVLIANFPNCDVPYRGVLPAECIGRSKFRDSNVMLKNHLNKTISRFQEGFTLAMVYDISVDYAAHTYGVDSPEVLASLQNVDSALLEFMENLKQHGLDEVNIIVTSDHGMTSLKQSDGVVYVKLEDYITNLDDIYKVLDYGPIVSILTVNGRREAAFRQLKKIPGVDAYKKKDIPEAFHYKEGRLVPDILLVARPGYAIVGIQHEKQIPTGNKAAYSVEPHAAGHGYFNMQDMRSIFFASGPAFKKGVIQPPFRLVDEYQVILHVLNVSGRHNSGNWKNVKNIFANL